MSAKAQLADHAGCFCAKEKSGLVSGGLDSALVSCVIIEADSALVIIKKLCGRGISVKLSSF